MPQETSTPDGAQEGSDLPEPTHSETRPRQAGEGGAERAHRSSVRPSAFGLPRAAYPSQPPASPTARGLTPEAAPTALETPRAVPAPGARSTAHAPSGSHSDQRALQVGQPEEEGETRPSRRLQNDRSRVVDQLTADAGNVERAPEPSPAAANGLEPQPTRVASQRAPTRTRRPWASVALFSAMLALSVVPLLRYALSHEQPQAAATMKPASASQVAASMAARVAREPASASGLGAGVAAPDAGREQQLITLIAAGNRALEEGAISDAERLFGRVVELDEDNPRAAYGLARVRLTQGNLSGAEGWIQLALRKRPRRRAYHALYAEVLMRLGRTDEAHEEERHTTFSEAPSEIDPRTTKPEADAP
ncbi:MAG TPA: tetratricopeptide repeat protein [Polyangiales bacterium]